MKKDAMFQFATPSKIIENTKLITLEDAKFRWHDNKEKFINLHNDGQEPEMCIWINCDDDECYRETLWHVDFQSIVKGNDIYNLEMQGYEK